MSCCCSFLRGQDRVSSSALGTRHSALGTQHSGLDARCQVPGARCCGCADDDSDARDVRRTIVDDIDSEDRGARRHACTMDGVEDVAAAAAAWLYCVRFRFRFVCLCFMIGVLFPCSRVSTTTLKIPLADERASSGRSPDSHIHISDPASPATYYIDSPTLYSCACARS